MKTITVATLLITSAIFPVSALAQGLSPSGELPNIELPEVLDVGINISDVPEALNPGEVLELLTRLTEIGENVSDIVGKIWGVIRSVIEQATGMDIREVGRSLLNIVIELLGVILNLFKAVATIL